MNAAAKRKFEEGSFEEFQKRLESQVSGRRDSLRNTILSFVTKDKFDLAIRELRYYQQFMSDLTPFVDRTERLFEHCEELILAVKAKKSFPNIDTLPMGKRQELFDRVQEHFDGLQNLLKRIEQIENDIKVQDSRSTVWVIQAVVVSVLVIVIFAFVNEAVRTMGLTFNVVTDDIIISVYKLLGI